ncbi:hypothetical protein DFR58_12818 [Anaerobacterium chartisolvens]|uniref:CAAX prenyl protease 2/Lysostaphin resistance protein A-like domain-containing protein n=1 Tax=Anaerobacterium chartisolvens TaxID=1297424 RepID=A0A369AMA5_9FIRM|nr:type II CAAX endopeptidase family protein [Anaerobacterium chartisolvens]RCX10519.1 hypothetical protein DFR58_12818 [Anaerobacterium chartisolvens]
MQKRITVTGANKVYFAVVSLFLIFSVLVELLSSWMQIDISKDYFYVVTLFSQFGLIMVPVLIYAGAMRLNFREIFRINRLKPLPALLIIAIALPAIYALSTFNSIMLFFLQLLGPIPTPPIPISDTPGELLAGLLTIGICPSICEELLHRGLLLSAYEKRGTTKAIAISAIMFGIFHFDISNLLGPIFMGLLIGYYVIRTNSIFAGMLAHFANNAVVELLHYGSDIEEGAGTSLSVNELGWILFFGGVAMVIIFMLLKVFKRVTRDTCRAAPAISTIRADAASVLSHWPIIASLALYAFITFLFILSIAII